MTSTIKPRLHYAWVVLAADGFEAAERTGTRFAPAMLASGGAALLMERIENFLRTNERTGQLTEWADQAIQNMNLMLGFPENAGLEQIALFP